MSFLPVFLFFIFLLFPFELSQKEKLILQIQRMPSEKKSALLQNLLLPYDLSYLPLHDLFTYREDAWLPKTCRRPADTVIRDVSLQDALLISARL